MRADRTTSEAAAKPNKPVLPTADTWLNEDPPDSLRRQTGQSFGSGGRRPSERRPAGNE